MGDTPTLVCCTCGESKLRDQFPLTKRSDGVMRPSTKCRECRRSYSREYERELAKDPTHVANRRERDRQRYAQKKDDPAFREKQRARSRAYTAQPEVKARAKVRAKGWFANNVERKRANATRWRRANPEKCAAYSKKARAKDLTTSREAGVCQQYVRRHAVFNNGGRFTIMQGRLCRVFWDNRRAYCGSNVPVPADERKNFDHVVPISKGGDNGPGNIVLACTRCNFAKNNRWLPVEVLDALRPQLELFVSLLPPESYEVRRNAPRPEVKAACDAAMETIRGRGVPLALSLAAE